MKKIEAIIRPDKLEVLKAQLDMIGYPGMMVMDIRGHGKQGGVSQQFRGNEYKTFFIPKVKVDIVVTDGDVKKVVDAITEVCRSGAVGDGKIFISSVLDSVRIRTGETGDVAVS